MIRRARVLFGVLLLLIAWTPVDAQGAARPVAARRIIRGAVLTSADISGESGAVAGWIARRVINAGEVLAPPAVSPPPIVHARQTVDVLVGRGSIRVLIMGTALADATLGDTITVRLDTRRRLRAVVSGPGRVTALAPSSR
jgi:flagella basal body P-ring formation protein FlgA